MESAPQVLPTRKAPESSEARERILVAAYELFAGKESGPSESTRSSSKPAFRN